jgi:hypothetical protein
MTKARQPPAKTSSEPEAARPHHTIVSLESTGGFLKGAKLEFADGLNCIIGCRGTGKTTVLEFMRYALALMPDEKTSPARSRAIRGLVQSNLGNGRLRLSVRTKHGRGYLAERPWNDTAQITNDQGEATTISFDRDGIFRADVYSQDEIEEIATNTNLQLALLDKFIEEDVRRIEGEIKKTERDLAQNASDILRLELEMRDLGESAADVAAIEEKLKGLQETAGPDAKAVNAAHTLRALREKERKTLEGLKSDIAKAATEFEAVVTGASRRFTGRIDKDVEAGANQEVFAQVAEQVREMSALLAACNVKVCEKADELAKIVDEQAAQLAERHAKQDLEYRALVAQSQEETGKAAERNQLQQRYLEVTTAQKDFDQRKRELTEREDYRGMLTNQLSELRNQRFELRKKVATELTEGLAPTIQVSITQSGNRDRYRELLAEALRNQSMKATSVADKIAAIATPEELVVLAKSNDAQRLAEKTGLDLERSRKVVDALRGSEMLYRIETVELDDLPLIELLDGKTYKDSAELSTGQRCTTILPILLRESERPLLIDQPEDNLDNAYIYATVVNTLRKAKGRRQLIFVTHNPNIPVLGDAERVFLLGSDGKQSKLEKVGTVDELKHDIETLLEGGSEAFMLRMKRYGH